MCAEVYAPYVFSGEVRRLYIKNDGEETKKYHVVFYEDLALNLQIILFLTPFFQIYLSKPQKSTTILSQRGKAEKGKTICVL